MRGAFVLDALKDLFAVHFHVFRSVDAEAYLTAFYSEHGDFDFVPDNKRLADAPGQYQHRKSSTCSISVQEVGRQ